MREPGVAIAGAIARDEGGLAFITCPDLDLRDWLVREVESLVPSDARPFRTSSVAEALGEPNRMALIIPNDEAEVVRDLRFPCGRRLEVRQPAVVALPTANQDRTVDLRALRTDLLATQRPAHRPGSAPRVFRSQRSGRCSGR